MREIIGCSSLCILSTEHTLYRIYTCHGSVGPLSPRRSTGMQNTGGKKIAVFCDSRQHQGLMLQ